MLQNTLDRIEIDFPPEANSISPDQWAIMAPEFGEALSVIVGELFSQMNLKTIKRLTVESRQQLLLPSTPDIELSQFRLASKVLKHA